jgi:hypothetical protein
LTETVKKKPEIVRENPKQIKGLPSLAGRKELA